MLLFLLQQLYGYVRSRVSKACKPYSLLNFLSFQNAAFSFTCFTCIALCDPDPALSAEPLASAGIIYEQACIQHYFHQIFAGGKIVLLSLRHNIQNRHYF